MYNNFRSSNQIYDITIHSHSDQTYNFDWNTKINKIIKNGHTYYSLPHNSEYVVRMHNYSSKRTNTCLFIDGEFMGKWRINANSYIDVERPVHNNRKFTFVRETSKIGKMGNITNGDFNNGLIEVTFTPELNLNYNYDCDYDYDYDRYNLKNSDCVIISCNNNSQEYMTGGTVLGHDSGQRFGNASHMTEDKSKSVTKRIRLIIEKRKPYVSLKTRNYNLNDPIPPKFNYN